MGMEINRKKTMPTRARALELINKPARHASK